MFIKNISPKTYFEGLYEVLTSNFRGNLSHIGPETEGLYCFYCAKLNLELKLPKRALCADRHPLRRDTIASRDRFRPMGARQNLVLYYNNEYTCSLFCTEGQLSHTSPTPSLSLSSCCGLYIVGQLSMELTIPIQPR